MSSTHDATASFYGYLRGLFQSERTNMLGMSEVNEVDHQSMQHMLNIEDAVAFAEHVFAFSLAGIQAIRQQNQLSS